MSSNSSTSTLFLNLLLTSPPLLLAWWSQARVKHVFREADQVENIERVNGYQTARSLLDESGLNNIPVVVGFVARGPAKTTRMILIPSKW